MLSLLQDAKIPAGGSSVEGETSEHSKTTDIKVLKTGISKVFLHAVLQFKVLLQRYQDKCLTVFGCRVTQCTSPPPLVAGHLAER